MASTLGNSALWLSFLFSILQFIVSTRNINSIIIFNRIAVTGLLASTLASFFLFYFTSFPIKDSTNSFRLFSKKLINTVTIESDKGFTLSLELTAKAHRLDFKIKEVPAIWMERNKGKSRFRIFSFLLPYTKWLFYIIKTSIVGKNGK